MKRNNDRDWWHCNLLTVTVIFLSLTHRDKHIVPGKMTRQEGLAISLSFNLVWSCFPALRCFPSVALDLLKNQKKVSQSKLWYLHAGARWQNKSRNPNFSQCFQKQILSRDVLSILPFCDTTGFSRFEQWRVYLPDDRQGSKRGRGGAGARGLRRACWCDSARMIAYHWNSFLILFCSSHATISKCSIFCQV